MRARTDKREQNRRTRREQVFRAALEIFGRYGYRKANLEDIAGKLDMTKSGLYRYCRDKRDLYEKAVSYGLTQWQQTAAASIAGETDPFKQLANYAMTGMMYLNGNTDLKNVLKNDPAVFPLNTRQDPFARINQESMNILKKILRRGVRLKRFRAMDIENTTAFLYSVYVMLIIRSYVVSDIESVEDMVRTGLDTVLRGIVRR